MNEGIILALATAWRYLLAENIVEFRVPTIKMPTNKGISQRTWYRAT